MIDQVQVQPSEKKIGTDGEFSRVVAWPLLQSIAVGFAGFLLIFSVLNFARFGKPLLAFSETPNTQFAALCGIIVFCLACMIFFLLDEVGYLIQQGSRAWADRRNHVQSKQYQERIDNILADWKKDIDELNILRSAAQRGTKKVVSVAGTGQSFGLSILENQRDFGTMARRSLYQNANMTEANWRSGIAYLLGEGMIKDNGNAGYAMLLNLNACITRLSMEVY